MRGGEKKKDLKHYETPPFSDPKRRLFQTWDEMRPVYQGDFSNLVFGTLPDESAILQTLTMIKGRLEMIKWRRD